MEEFRKKVEKRLRIDTMFCGSAMAMYLALMFLTKGASDFAQGISLGVFCGLEIVAVYHLAKTFSVLHNEDKLKEMYIAETDERNIAIAKETSQKSSVISMTLTSAAAVAAGFFDVKVCLTLVASLLVESIIMIGVNIYCKKNM